jgi:hypothetical protein
LQAGAKQLDPRNTKRIAFEQGNFQLALAQAQHHVSLLRHLHQQAGRRRLPHDDVDGLIAIHAIRDAKHQPTRAQHSVSLADIFADQVGHGYFAAVDSNPHRRDGAKKGGGSEDKNEKSRLAEGLQTLAESHNVGRMRFEIQSRVSYGCHKSPIASHFFAGGGGG